MKKPPPYPGDDPVWSAEAIEFFILPVWLRGLADKLDRLRVDIDTNSIRDGADEIDRLRSKYEPEWAPLDEELQ